MVDPLKPANNKYHPVEDWESNIQIKLAINSAMPIISTAYFFTLKLPQHLINSL